MAGGLKMESAESIIILNKKQQEEWKKLSLSNIFKSLKGINENELSDKIKDAIISALKNKKSIE